MNKTPSILVDTGFEVDQNGALTELDVPSVVTTLDPPKKVVFNGPMMNWLPSHATTLQELYANNITTANVNLDGFIKVTKISFNSLQSISISGNVNNGFCRNCTSLQELNLPSLISIYKQADGGSGGVFDGCTGLMIVTMPELKSINCATTYGVLGNCTSLTSVSMPKLETISYGGIPGYVRVFHNCTNLNDLTLPSIKNIANGNASNGVFNACTGLQTLQLGSDGHPVTSIGNNTFSNCTQSGLTITIYTQGGASLSGEPWGATNATIEYEEA